ncbi:MAG TPA: hypothetical protein P5250_02660 [Bacteroidales bacterium]|nr:hypothetical protein [Bacteroidales bacterium]
MKKLNFKLKCQNVTFIDKFNKKYFLIQKVAVFFLIISVTSSVIITSCKKDDNDSNTKTYNYRSAKDNSLAESIFSGIHGQIDRAAKKDSLKSSDSLSCPTLTISGTTYPRTFTLDFGTNCLCNDGRIRSGQIISVITGPYLDSLTTITSTFNNYYETINNINYYVTGTHVVKNLGKNAAGHPYYSVNVSNASISSVNGTITWASQRYREFYQGYNSILNPFDDIYLITGSANGNDINGDPFTVNIINPLMWQFGCPWIKAGSIEITNPGYPTITVDYGTGNCDNVITVTINGVTYTVIVN